MKRILLSAVALALIAGAAQAQSDQDRHDANRVQHSNSQANRQAPNRSAPQANTQRYAPQARSNQQQGAAHYGAQTYRGQQTYAPNRNQVQPRAYAPAYQQNRRYEPSQNGYGAYRQGAAPSYNRSGGAGYNRYGGSGYNRNTFASRDWWRGRRGFESYEGHRSGYWYAPGWGYYRPDPQWYGYDWQVGVVVPYDLRGYGLSDPYDYGLPPAPYGTQWIFLDDQLVLIDLETGEIVQMGGEY